jgi:hypothetical protein
MILNHDKMSQELAQKGNQSNDINFWSNNKVAQKE